MRPSCDDTTLVVEVWLKNGNTGQKQANFWLTPMKLVSKTGRFDQSRDDGGQASLLASCARESTPTFSKIRERCFFVLAHVKETSLSDLRESRCRLAGATGQQTDRKSTR